MRTRANGISSRTTISPRAFKVNGASTTLAVGHTSTSAYTFSPQYSGDNPTLSFVGGKTVAFNLAGVSGHPFKIQDGEGVDYNDGLLHVADDGTVTEGVNAQEKDSGILLWRIPEALTGIYKYVCAFHGSMTGDIEIVRIKNEVERTQPLGTLSWVLAGNETFTPNSKYVVADGSFCHGGEPIPQPEES